MSERLSRNSSWPIGQVPAVDEDTKRPLWSVMIPTFNCAQFLRQTLESVLAQDPGPDLMQIEVVDDCSNLDDPGKVVREVGGGRVAFHRNSRNSGYCTLNFNVCVQRSVGHLVHILHGDDWVSPGFYKQIEELAVAFPSASLYATRCFTTNAVGELLRVSPLLEAYRAPSTDLSMFRYETPLQCASVVVRRSAYEARGGFMNSLVHTSDWEMWTRAIAYSGGVVAPSVLAFYRVFESNDSGRLAKTAENLEDFLRLAEILAKRIPNFDRGIARDHLLRRAASQELLFSQMGDRHSAQNNAEFWRANATFVHKIKRLLRTFVGKHKA